MIPNPRRVPLLGLLALGLVLRPTVAQDLAKEEQDLVKQCVSTLSSFASNAKSQKVGQRAKQAYDLILQYDPDNNPARSELGFKKEKGQWVELPPEKRKKWLDKAGYEGRFKVVDEWAKTATKLGDIHRKLGLKLKAAGNADRAKYHLEKAVYYNAMDKEANLALGYKEGPGFFGTEQQIEFAKKMKEIEIQALQIARKDYPVEALGEDKMPKELVAFRDAVPEWMKKPSFEIHGAKSEHFTVWTRGTQENADNAVKWGERALEFGVYLLGEKKAKELLFVEKASKTWAWRAFVWTPREREEFLKANPHVWKDDGSVEKAMQFVNTDWRLPDGGLATLQSKIMPVQIHDSMIAYVFQDGLISRATEGQPNRNQGLSQGIIHAVTWYMQYTSISRWGALPEGTVGDRENNLPESTNWWLRAVRDQAMSSQDWALNQVPRERLAKYRNDCRLKAWSFTTWAMAAYPEKWLDFFLALPDDKKPIPTLEEVDAIGEKVFGKKLAVIDEEWREWARGDSGVAFGTGYGPPLLPERPSKEELAVLDRLNAVRATPLAFSWPEDKQPWDGAFAGMPACELDAETSIACEDHAHFLARWPEQHLKWPEAHEENPALEGFSPRGQRAAMGSVIIHRKGQGGVEFAKDSVDGWLGTPYHRFPLLEHNIKRFGYSFLYENDLTVAVLDMGSLEEPYDPAAAPRLICWPPHGMKDVPTDFHGIEQPNPLEDQPEKDQDITKTGYPVSLQLQRELAGRVSNATMQLYEARSSGKAPTVHFVVKGSKEQADWHERCKKEVPTWLHTPQVPLNRKVEIRDVVFVIPKERLEAGKHFQARVMLTIGDQELWFYWEFSTGSQQEGLKLK